MASATSFRSEAAGPAAITYPAGIAASDILVDDLNGDRRIDVVATDAGGSAVTVLLGNGDGSFLNGQVFSTGAKPQGVAVGDLNGDGKPDVITANYVDNNVSVLLNR